MLPPKILQLEAMEKQGATPEQIDGSSCLQQPTAAARSEDGQGAAGRPTRHGQAAAGAAASIAEMQLEMRRIAATAGRHTSFVASIRSRVCSTLNRRLRAAFC
jgi:hypothetical protein